jgi:hypothetical protein
MYLEGAHARFSGDSGIITGSELSSLVPIIHLFGRFLLWDLCIDGRALFPPSIVPLLVAWTGAGSLLSWFWPQ